MGAARKIDIHGAKGGEDKPKTPTEAPDSLRSVAIAKMLIAIGEGEFEGTPTARDIYLDNTPLQDPQGNMNFPNVKWEWRTGAVDQSYIQGIPSVENETTISTELRSGTPWVRAISNTQLSAVRVRFAWPALQSVDSSGNINVLDGSNLVGIGLNPSVRHEEAEQLAGRNSESTLLRVKHEVYLTEAVEGLAEVLDERPSRPNPWMATVGC